MPGTSSKARWDSGIASMQERRAASVGTAVLLHSAQHLGRLYRYSRRFFAATRNRQYDLHVVPLLPALDQMARLRDASVSGVPYFFRPTDPAFRHKPNSHSCFHHAGAAIIEECFRVRVSELMRSRLFKASLQIATVVLLLFAVRRIVDAR